MSNEAVEVGASGLDELRAAIEGEGFTTVFQPIVELDAGRVLGYEALTRFGDDRGPQWWFEEAARCGLHMELELSTARSALARVDDIPARAFLSVNASPAMLAAPVLPGLIGGVGRRLVMEVLETSEIDDYAAFERALGPLRQLGVRVALDDMGAGFARLGHLFNVHPDIVKLDMALVRDIDADPVRQALARSIATYADETGVLVVAEGIETERELVTLRLLGVQAGQGYLLGRPAPLDTAKTDH